MLKHLLKYEWQATRKVLVIINAFTVIITILGLLTINTLDYELNPGAKSIVILIFMLYYITILSVSFAMSIYCAVRFYRNLYTDEGYLMHTLPVTKRQLVISKLLIHSLCMLITELILLASVGVLLLPLLSRLLETPDLFLHNLLHDLMELCRSTGVSLPVFVLVGSISNLIGLVSGILMIYCAIILGQTFHQHKVMGSILCYIGLYSLVQTITSVLIMPQTMMLGNQDFNAMTFLIHAIPSVSISSLFLGILWYGITLHMMNEKLNLD